VGGGQWNSSTGYASTKSGGRGSIASGEYTTVSGGRYNYARGSYSVVAGGGGAAQADSNHAAYYGTVGGGLGDIAGGLYSTVGGGAYNIASGNGSFIGGGNRNRARGEFATVAGGGGETLADSNCAFGNYSAIGGGYHNTAGNVAATIAGGYYHIASGNSSTIGGGYDNEASNYYSTIGGGAANYASGQYSTIAGGRSNIATITYATVGGGYSNQADSNYATVGGGYDSWANGQAATVSGGRDNYATSSYATVSGGYNNSASFAATVPGGYNNDASGYYSFAAGRRAKANHNGCFVWGDSYDGDIASANVNQFRVRASGGTWIYSNTALSAGVALASGANAWVAISDSTKKRNIRLVDTGDILNRVSQLPIKQWNYKSQDPSIEHIGPMAQDFYKLFHLGEDSLGISTIDPDGIALAAIQELQRQNAELKRELNELRSLVEKMATQHDANSGKTASAAFMPKTQETILKEITQ
jgi:hypothetical protein